MLRRRQKFPNHHRHDVIGLATQNHGMTRTTFCNVLDIDISTEPGLQKVQLNLTDLFLLKPLPWPRPRLGRASAAEPVPAWVGQRPPTC